MNKNLSTNNCDIEFTKMNKRIKELTEQAGFYVVDDRIYIPTTSEDITVYHAKFVELIIQECMQVSMDSVGLDAEYEAWYLIGQHFGVE